MIADSLLSLSLFLSLRLLIFDTALDLQLDGGVPRGAEGLGASMEEDRRLTKAASLQQVLPLLFLFRFYVFVIYRSA